MKLTWDIYDEYQNSNGDRLLGRIEDGGDAWVAYRCRHRRRGWQYQLGRFATVAEAFAAVDPSGKAHPSEPSETYGTYRP